MSRDTDTSDLRGAPLADVDGHRDDHDPEPRDYIRIRNAIGEVLSVIDDPERPDIRDTPERVARMYLEVTQPEPFQLTCFPNSGGYDQMIIEDDISFYSLCEHHLIPFFGLAKVAYIPKEEIVGLSKLARTVDHFSRGLQTQERITNAIADLLMDRLHPEGVGVRLEAEHLCMSMRGVKKPGARTVTIALRGGFKEGPTRDEFLR